MVRKVCSYAGISVMTESLLRGSGLCSGRSHPAPADQAERLPFPLRQDTDNITSLHSFRVLHRGAEGGLDEDR